MTHRGPCRPLLFCDSVILWSAGRAGPVAPRHVCFREASLEEPFPGAVSASAWWWGAGRGRASLPAFPGLTRALRRWDATNPCHGSRTAGAGRSARRQGACGAGTALSFAAEEDASSSKEETSKQTRKLSNDRGGDSRGGCLRGSAEAGCVLERREPGDVGLRAGRAAPALSSWRMKK